GDHDYGVALVGRVPDVARAVERDAVGALEIRVRDEDVVQAKGIGGEGCVAAGAALELASAMELHLPDGAAGRIGDVEVAVGREGEAVRHERLRIRRWISRLQRSVRPSDTGGVGHRLNAERFDATAERRLA